MKLSFVSSQAISQAMRYQMLRMQADLLKANKEVVTLRVADTGLALGARTGMSVSFHREIERLKGLTDSNALAASRLASTQLALRQTTDAADKLLAAYTTAFSSASDGKIARDEAESFLASLTSGLNSHLNGEHLFAGINTDVKPLNDFLDPTSLSRSAFDQEFNDYFFGVPTPLVTDISEITTAQMDDFLTTVVTPQFDAPAWHTNWSSATDQQIVSRITLTETAQTSVSANISPFRKLSMAAASVAAMVGRGMPQATEKVILEKAMGLIGEAVVELAQQQGHVGIIEQRIERANERMSMQTDLISKNLNNLEGVDENEAAVRLNGLIAQIELSYSLTARMQQMSLLKYL